MKYIKLFENNSIGVDYDKNVCWIIDGDFDNILSILYSLINDYMKDTPNRIKDNNFYNELELLIHEMKMDAFGLNFDSMMLFSKTIPYEYNRVRLSFKFLKNLNLEMERIISQEKCTLLGELKMENGKVVLDTSGDIIRTKKYNL